VDGQKDYRTGWAEIATALSQTVLSVLYQSQPS